MKYECPEDERELHELESTMCHCGPDLVKNAEGDDVIRHIPFNIQTLLKMAEDLIQNNVYPCPPPWNKKKRF